MAFGVFLPHFTLVVHCFTPRKNSDVDCEHPVCAAALLPSLRSVAPQAASNGMLRCCDVADTDGGDSLLYIDRTVTGATYLCSSAANRNAMKAHTASVRFEKVLRSSRD